MERNIRDALSPELERVIQENERAAAAAGLTFPTGDEVLEKGSETSSAADGLRFLLPVPPGIIARRKSGSPEWRNRNLRHVPERNRLLSWSLYLRNCDSRTGRGENTTR
jgi:hypothetical protein